MIVVGVCIIDRVKVVSPTPPPPPRRASLLVFVLHVPTQVFFYFRVFPHLHALPHLHPLPHEQSLHGHAFCDDCACVGVVFRVAKTVVARVGVGVVFDASAPGVGVFFFVNPKNPIFWREAFYMCVCVCVCTHASSSSPLVLLLLLLLLLLERRGEEKTSSFFVRGFDATKRDDDDDDDDDDDGPDFGV